MTVPVPDQLEYISDADGVTKDFSYPKRFLQKDEIVVLLRDADGVDTPQILNTHYTIAGSSWSSGGTISFVTAPVAPNKVVRYRMTQAKQTVDLENNQRNDAPSVELQLDRLAMAIQDRGGILTDLLLRSVKMPFGYTGSTVMPWPDPNKLIGWNENGNGFANKDILSSGHLVVGDAGKEVLAKDTVDGIRDYLEIKDPVERLFDSALLVSTLEIESEVNAIRTSGYYTVGDGGGALYKRVSGEPSHAGKVQSADGAWWELAASRLSPRMFGAKGDWSRSTLTGTDNGNALRAMLSTSKALGGLPMVIDGRFAFSGSLPITNTPVSIRGEWFSGAILVCTSDSDGIVINQDDYWNSTYVEGVSVLTQVLTTKTALSITYSAADSIGNRNFPRCVVRGVNMYGVDLLQHGWGGGLLATDVHNATYDEITVNGRRNQTLPDTDIAHWASMLFGIKIVGSNGFTAVPSDILINNPKIYGAIAGIDLAGECEGVRIDNYILVGVRYGIRGSMTSIRPWVQILSGHINYLTRGILLTNSPQSNIDGALLYKFQFSTEDSYAIDVTGCDHSQFDNIRLYNLCADYTTGKSHNGIAIANSVACSVGDVIAHNPTRVIQITGTSSQCKIKTPLMQGAYLNSPSRDAVFDSSTGSGNEYGGVITQTSNTSALTISSSASNILTTVSMRLGKGERVQVDVALRGDKPGAAGFIFSTIVPASSDGGTGAFGLNIGTLASRQFGVTGNWEAAYSGIYSVTTSGTFTFTLQAASAGSDASVAAQGVQISVRRL